MTHAYVPMARSLEETRQRGFSVLLLASKVWKTVASDPRNVAFFAYVRCSDESFFQTILGNSGLVTRCTRADVYTDWSHPLDAPCYITEQHISLFAQPDFCLVDGYGRDPVNFAPKSGTKKKHVAVALPERLSIQ